MYIVHIFPSVAFLINHQVTEVVVYDGHGKGLVCVGIFYAAVNAYYTITTGVALYSFLTWKDYTSPLICMVLVLGFFVVFGSVANLTRMMKPHMQSQKVKKG